MDSEVLPMYIKSDRFLSKEKQRSGKLRTGERSFHNKNVRVIIISFHCFCRQKGNHFNSPASWQASYFLTRTISVPNECEPGCNYWRAREGRGRQGQNDWMLKLFHFKEHLSETSSGTLLMEVKHHRRRDVNLGPPLPFLYALCVKENYSYIPTKDLMFATALLIGTNKNQMFLLSFQLTSI